MRLVGSPCPAGRRTFRSRVGLVERLGASDMAGSSLVSYPLVDLLYPGLLGASLGCLGLQIKPKNEKNTILRNLGGDGGGGGGVHADPRIKLPPVT